MRRKTTSASSHLPIWTCAIVLLHLLTACGSEDQAPPVRSDLAARLQGEFKESRGYGTGSIQRGGESAVKHELAWLSSGTLNLEDGGSYESRTEYIWLRRGSVDSFDQLTVRDTWSLANGRLRLAQKEFLSTRDGPGTPTQEALHYEVREKDGHIQLDGVNTSGHLWNRESAPPPEVAADSLVASYWREPFVRWKGDQSAPVAVGRRVAEFETGALELKADGTFVRTITRTSLDPDGFLEDPTEMVTVGKWRASGRSVMLSPAGPLGASGDEVLAVGRVAGQYCLTRTEEVWHQGTD